MFRTLLFVALWLFLAGATLWHTQINPIPFPYDNIDEQAHYSYTRDLIDQHRWWPDFNLFPMVDTETNQQTPATNYLNHPPTFYWLMKAMQKIFPDASPLHYRRVALVFALLTISIYIRMGMGLALPPFASIIYAALPILFYLPLQLGFYNNDSMAIAGGTLACWGSAYMLQGGGRGRGATYLALGLALASVKLTAFLLVGIYTASFLWSCRSNISRATCARLGLLMALLGIPYIFMTFCYGSPVPNTPGQTAWLLEHAKLRGWYDAPRLDFIPWLYGALSDFTDQFATRETTFLPLLMLPAAFLCLLLPRSKSEPLWFRPIAHASCFATCMVLAAHLGYSWQRHLRYGWLHDMFTRYYFPLLPAYGATIAGAYLRLSGGKKPLESTDAT